MNDNKDIEEPSRAIRVLLPNELYEKVKKQCPDHGMISQLIRALLEKYVRGMEE